MRKVFYLHQSTKRMLMKVNLILCTSEIDIVQSALDLYEKSKEWADLIKWLQRLSKVHLFFLMTMPTKQHQVLSKHTFSIIPHKMILSRRLAQCLNPTLPSGVHLKALETYSLIFDKIKVSSKFVFYFKFYKRVNSLPI